ncbi:MAG: HupE/UreJ family protein [Chlorobi bacterium]|nr:HupE/UreJ family protein [Chlorobiota bacterium]
MSIFELYLNLGIHHIADLRGYDHILFISTLIAVYQLKHWKKVIVLVTAFTIGHSTTLALATLHILRISPDWIEFLIPVTIFITAFINLLQKSDNFDRDIHFFKYLTALFFGLIHGLGFSNYLRSLLGAESSFVWPLFSFNLGIEVGQFIIVSIVLALNLVLVKWVHIRQRDWRLVISGAGLGVSLVLMGNRFPF